MKSSNANAKLLPVLAAVILASQVAPAVATTVTGNISVSATALSSCTIVASPLAFGNYAQTLTTASATLAVICTATSPYTIGLNQGTTTGGTQSARLLYNTISGTTLAYSLYTDSGHSSPWTSNTVSGTGTGLSQIVNVYGTIAAGLQAAPGAYADTVTATLSY